MYDEVPPDIKGRPNRPFQRETHQFNNSLEQSIQYGLGEYFSTNKNIQTQYNDSFRTVVISPLAYMKMILHAEYYANSSIPRHNWVEIIGFLLGKKENNSNQIIIQDTFCAGHGSEATVQITDFSFITTLMESTPAETVLVGWYHSHPSYGLFMSSIDLKTQRAWQQHWQDAIAIVLDPTLVSSVHYGLDVFRLDNNLEFFDDKITFTVKNFSPRPFHKLKELLQHTSY